MHRPGSNTIFSTQYDPWNLPQPEVSPLPFSLNIGSDWVIKSYEDMDGNAYGFFYKPLGDTINYKVIKSTININAIRKISSMSYYENLILEGHRAAIFNENSNWIGYYVHSDSMFNMLEIRNVKDEILIKNLMRNYNYK
jgi:hypothetical protein